MLFGSSARETDLGAHDVSSQSDFTNQIQTQALAQARDEAHRWHDQCTRMEAAREVRAAQIDALIQALRVSTVSFRHRHWPD